MGAATEVLTKRHARTRALIPTDGFNEEEL